ncbi:Polynucleotide 5'-hydroxyl-kinase GRC3 [Colletotrichum orbiculare MAFF 240422]|uniref:Polynucleotide 5'-hydroxyl-kinase GRC3 n=1 Tax=Colletotrichum orbiculare (strain 104-T / ATCC 96160 / CBS 514.97 / LARS 414 / MAFF 240422) TaxID=1213857 RepID=N4V6T2_COLOR|nr:Polynucleotide 5'-hydroxyl-kinase GRC3 [Colletotrichum orbiculare MAFF 240422]
MTTPKRRKIETSDGSKPMSAFALRQQLLSASPSLSSPTSQQEVSESQASTPARSPTKGKSPRANEKADSQGQGLIGQEAQQFSTFRPNKSNSRKLQGRLHLRLKDSERFLVLGSYGITVIEGEITIAGASIRSQDGTKWVHAPHCHGIPVIRCSDETTLEIQSHPQANSLRKLGRLSPLFRSLWNEPDQKSPKTDTYKIICTSNDAPKRALIQDLRSHPAWNKKLAGLSKKVDPVLSVMLCGPKSSGKSTFGRILGNRLLTSPGSDRLGRSIVVLDLDPGQPEYTPAGTIALVQVKQPNLSPAFAHVATDEQAATVIRCHSIASVSPASDPELYLECALDLHRHYQKTCRGLPLIINTPGWILGTGLDLLTELIANFKPTEVIYMSEDGPKESVDGLKSACKGNFTMLPSQQSEFTSRTAAHLRSMQALAYFHTKRTPEKTAWDPTPLTSWPPLMVKYNGKSRGVFGVIAYEQQLPANLVAELLNGSMLCLVEIEDTKAFSRLRGSDDMDVDGESTPLEDIISHTPEGIPFIPNADGHTLDPRNCQTLGLVLVRGIDPKQGVLQILTPIPLARIQSAKKANHQLVLIYGNLDTPGWAYTEELYYQANDKDDNDRDGGVEIMDEDTESDNSDEEPENPRFGEVSDTQTPWIEVLQGHEKRPVGSRVWRVRRDLGRAGPGNE